MPEMAGTRTFKALLVVCGALYNPATIRDADSASQPPGDKDMIWADFCRCGACFRRSTVERQGNELSNGAIRQRGRCLARIVGSHRRQM